MTRPFLFVAFALSPISALGQGFSPAEAVKRMKLPPGFTGTAVATESMIRQPVSISFDCRGRLWVLQYLQYPNPAGLKPVRQDQYLRTVWDRVPEPPPKGPRGADRLTICYDPDESGVFRKSKDFVTGLNLASGFCLGNGGVYVVQPPYLLFYPDKNEDDVPDGDPEVLLTGFGMDDTHSLANSLQWGPDGWLYGAAGSTSTCKIRNPAGKPTDPPVEFQQGIWRYHPPTKRFELFSEGGGNTYGLDFDRHGQAIAGTNWGGFAMLHQVQGAYYVKGFAKHGPLHNPHTYGYFDHVPYTGFKGGHVTCGGIVYQGGAYPTEYDDQYIAGNLLSNAVYWHKLTPDRDTFKASHGGDFLVANDDWFRPVDLTIGPDGCVYVADWYDRRAAHLDPIDNWDKTNGRVYRISYNGTPVAKPFDLRKKTQAELVELLKHPNVWWRREARRLIGHDIEPGLFRKLKSVAVTEKSDLALEAFWMLADADLCGEQTLCDCLDSPNEFVRAWAVRSLGDSGFSLFATKLRLGRQAREERSPTVLSQLACTAGQLAIKPFWPGDLRSMAFSGLVSPAVDIIEELLVSPHSEASSQLPLLIWWAVERKVTATGNRVPTYFFTLSRLNTRSRLVSVTVERLVRRLLTDGGPDGQQDVQTLLSDWDAAGQHEVIFRGIAVALDGGTRKFDPQLMNSIRKAGNGAPSGLRSSILARLGDADTIAAYRKRLQATSTPDAERIAAVKLLGQIKDAELKPQLIGMWNGTLSANLRTAVLEAFDAFDDPQIGSLLIETYRKQSATDRKRMLSILATRKRSAALLFAAVADGRIPLADISLDHARTAAAFNDPAINAVIEKHFGKVGPATPGEKLARIASLDTALGRTPGNPVVGKPLFTKHCANCHKLHDEGNAVGPDLTSADRKNRRLLLTNIVDPSANVRPEFVSHVVALADGRKLTGLVAAADANAVTLLDAENRRTVLPRADIESLTPSAVSLMPEKLLDTLTDQQVADLFAYLQSTKK